MPTSALPHRHQLLAFLRLSSRHRFSSHGRAVHAHLLRTGIRHDPPFPVALLDMYGKCSLFADALLLFDETTQRNAVLWSSLLTTHVDLNRPLQCLSLLPVMIDVDDVMPDDFIFATLVKACAQLGELRLGRQVHGRVMSSPFYDDDVIKSALINMYSKCQLPSDARKVFDGVSFRNTICWTAMVSGYASNGHLLDAVTLFRMMPEKALMTWTSLISGFVRSGDSTCALKMFVEMQREGAIRMDDCFVLSSVLGAAASLPSLELGCQLHGLVMKYGFESSLFVGNALVDMYAKCSDIIAARSVFERLTVLDNVSWTAMIIGESQHGQAERALVLFDRMLAAGMTPNEITFVGLLSACCHAGLVEKGCFLFKLMVEDYGLTPSLQHYTCMLDLLSRSGLLSEAEYFIKQIQIEPDQAMWAALLSSCKIRGDNERCIRIADHMLTLQPKDPSAYVLLSNIYAIAMKWDRVAEVRNLMAHTEERRETGCSWVEIGKQSYLFHAGQMPQRSGDDILELLRLLPVVDMK